MMSLNDLKMYARFIGGLPAFYRTTLSLEESENILKRRILEREKNFLFLVEKGIFGHSESPYLPLMRMAGCRMGDIREMVRSRGLEETLLALRQAGVYVTFEELKGRSPIRRNGLTLSVNPHDFDNPCTSRHLTAESGGSTGAGTRVDTDLGHIAATAPYLMVTKKLHGVLGQKNGAHQ